MLTTLPAHTITYVDNGLTVGTTYTYRVDTTNSAGTSPYSNQSSATAKNVSAPAAPTNLTAASASATSIALNWTLNATNQTATIIERV